MSKERINEMEKEDYLHNVDILYERAVVTIIGNSLFGHAIDIENPKEVVAALFVLYMRAWASSDSTKKILNPVKHRWGG